MSTGRSRTGAILGELRCHVNADPPFLGHLGEAEGQGVPHYRAYFPPCPLSAEVGLKTASAVVLATFKTSLQD
jgi:hypothetical protein